MKKNVLVDIKITCDPPSNWYIQRAKTEEERAKRYEEWVKEFHDFIRDHRSQDPVYLNVEREYQERCEFCGELWADAIDENGIPGCCNKAVKEYELQKAG
jgi:hypothetical protein